MDAIDLYVGGDAYTVQGRPCQLTGLRCFSGAYGPKSRFRPEQVPNVRALLDSGAFSDCPAKRLTPVQALERQLHWEANASRIWGVPWHAVAIVSYDLLIDEKWAGGQRKKIRWSVAEADASVQITVDAAQYLASQREVLCPRQLVLACQGVDHVQYAECVDEVLRYVDASDWIGLGGWCILGRHRRLIPEFWRTCDMVLPAIAQAGVRNVHIFGVMTLLVLGPLLWLCDQLGLRLSTDSSGPILASTWKDAKKAGVLAPTWEVNVASWQDRLRRLRSSRWYHEPALQHELFSGGLAAT